MLLPEQEATAVLLPEGAESSAARGGEGRGWSGAADEQRGVPNPGCCGESRTGFEDNPKTLNTSPNENRRDETRRSDLRLFKPQVVLIQQRMLQTIPPIPLRC